eukprot:SAG11_NODE_1382_length_5077_cov_15.913620_3_plen_357_part_00
MHRQEPTAKYGGLGNSINKMRQMTQEILASLEQSIDLSATPVQEEEEQIQQSECSLSYGDYDKLDFLDEFLTDDSDGWGGAEFDIVDEPPAGDGSRGQRHRTAVQVKRPEPPTQQGSGHPSIATSIAQRRLLASCPFCFGANSKHDTVLKNLNPMGFIDSSGAHGGFTAHEKRLDGGRTRNRRRKSTARKKVRIGRWLRGYGYFGPKYCQRCSEIFTDHLVRQMSNSADCTRERPCCECYKMLHYYPVDVWERVAAKAAVRTLFPSSVSNAPLAFALDREAFHPAPPLGNSPSAQVHLKDVHYVCFLMARFHLQARDALKRQRATEVISPSPRSDMQEHCKARRLCSNTYADVLPV